MILLLWAKAIYCLGFFSELNLGSVLAVEHGLIMNLKLLCRVTPHHSLVLLLVIL